MRKDQYRSRLTGNDLRFQRRRFETLITSAKIKYLRFTCFAILLSAVCLHTIYACRGQKDSDLFLQKQSMKNHINKIIYRFEDASVPPQYHRSYTITLSPQKLHIIIDSYGSVLAEKEYLIKSTQFMDIVNSLTANRIRKQSFGDDGGCSGGTAEMLSCWDETREIFSASVYHCGGKDFGNLSGNIKDLVSAIKKLVPDLDKLLK
jgi:hypothetical protein